MKKIYEIIGNEECVLLSGRREQMVRFGVFSLRTREFLFESEIESVLAEDWAYSHESGVIAAISRSEGWVHIISGRTGERLFHFRNQPVSWVSIWKGRVRVAGGSKITLFEFDGSIVERGDLEGRFCAFVDEKVVVADRGMYVIYNPFNPDEKWAYPLNGLGVTSVDCDDQVIVVCVSRGGFSVIDRSSGAVLWHRCLPVEFNPISCGVRGGDILVGSVKFKAISSILNAYSFSGECIFQREWARRLSMHFNRYIGGFVMIDGTIIRPSEGCVDLDEDFIDFSIDEES